MLSAKQQYQQKLADHALQADPYQEDVVNALETLFNELTESLKPPPCYYKWSLFNYFFCKNEKQPIKGLYVWGGVGRGKTVLCDMFFNTVNTERKMRLHYHRFMILVQESLMALSGEVDPVDKVAEQWAQEYSLLVLDEMHINDITSALLMKRLLNGLFTRGVVLVTTSNVPPDGLYKDGLQRQEFLPAIILLETNTQVMHLDGGDDYRLQTLKTLEIYLTPLSAEIDMILNGYFREIAGDQREQTKLGVAIINEREIPIVKRATGIIWFDFEDICNSMRANDDYIEIASFYHTVIISHVPQMNEELDDAARRFVNMIDEFYDNATNLIISAEVVVEELYQGKKLQFEFQRAISRLIEMRTDEYFPREHLG